MTAQHISRRGAGSRVLGCLLLLLLPASARAQAAAPLAVLTRDALHATGRSGLAEAVQALLPAFNLPRPSVAGSSDHVRPASFRGLGSDQLLVLINGKRRQPSALLNVDASIGRGQGMVDLAAIPLSAVERVEVLAGDPARYGFGAVAGVLNVILLADAPDRLTAELATTSEGDGTVLQAGGNHRIRWGPAGTAELVLELSRAGATNRALPDRRPQYFFGDLRNGDPPRVDQRFGDPATRQVAAMLTATQRVRGNVEGYAVAGWSYRSSEAGERWRRPSDDRTVRALFPNGFLPLITLKLQDGSALAGLRGSLWGWSWDASVGYARNSVRVDLAHTANPSLGTASPTRFDAGTLRADQFSSELQLSHRLAPGGALPPLLLELGAAHRSDGYQIEAGEPDSYRFGAVPILDGPDAGQLAPVGAQGFNAFRPGEAVIRRRGMLAGSGALSAVVFQRLALTAEGRVEYYPVLGATVVYALHGELGPVAGVALRGGYGTGARVAPLAQSWYGSSSTGVVGQFGFDDRTVPLADPIAVLLGAKRLRPERSRDLELGATVTRVRGLTLRADFYRVLVDHRIILSGTFDDPAVLNFLAQQHIFGISGVRFFGNALATRTTGVDAQAGYRLALAGAAVELSAGWNHHTTRVALQDSVAGVLAQFSGDFFERTERARYELGQPRDNLILGAVGSRAEWSVLARAQRAGPVSSYGAPLDGSLDQSYGAKWLADLGVSYRYRRRLTLTLGGDNLLNTRPDRNRFGDAASEGNSSFGMFPYPNISPFGFSGRRLYLQATWH